MLGSSVSFTVTRNVHVFVRPASSVAFHATVLAPLGNVEPLGKPLWIVTVGKTVQLSEAVGAAYVTTAVHWPGSVLRVRFPGQVMLGACPSVTVTVKVQRWVRLTASVACQMTDVTPLGNVEPLAGPSMRRKEALPQLSENVGLA